MEKVQTLAEYLGVDFISDSGHVSELTPSPLDTVSVKEFCRMVLSSPEYRRSILTRIAEGSLPPAIEVRMYDYAFGKPKETLEVQGELAVRKIVREIVTTADDADRQDVVH